MTTPTPAVAASSSGPGASRRGWVIVAALYCGLAAITAAMVGERWTAPAGLRLTVFEAPTWQGHRVLETVDAALSDERLGTPPLPYLQTYSAEWTGVLAVPADGDYGFRTRSDDGSTLEIDGELVVDNAGQHAIREVSATRHLNAGPHAITVRYFQDGGRYSLSVLWAPPGRPFEAIPPRALRPEAMSGTAARLRPLVPWAAAALVLVAFGALAAGFVSLTRRRVAGHGAATAPPPNELRIEAVMVRAITALERPAVAVVVLLLTGVAARVAMFVTTPAILWPDSHVFYVTMREIVGGAFTSHDAYRTLIYPYLMTAILGQHRSPAAGAVFVAVQQSLGLLSCLGLYAVGRRVFPPLVALAGAALLAVHGMQLFYELSILTETLFTAVLAATLWLAFRCYDRPGVARSAALGLSLAVLVLVRPVAQWFVVCVIAAGWLARREWPGRARRHGRDVFPDRRAWTASVAVLLFCYALPLLAWMSVNQREYGFFGVSLGRGMGLYTRVFEIDGLVPPASADAELRALWATARGLRWSPNRVRDELDYNHGVSAAVADDRLYRFALDTIVAHPGAFVAGTMRQWVRQIASPDSGVRACASAAGRVLCSGRNDAALPPFPGDDRDGHPLLRRLVVAYVADWPLPMTAVAACALIGAVALLVMRPWTAHAALVLLSVGYFTAVPALSQAAQDRFRLPIDGLLFMLAVHGLRAAGRWLVAAPATDRVLPAAPTAAPDLVGARCAAGQ